LLCSPNQKIIIETQFNPVASHHLNLLEKNIYAKKNILKRSFAKNTIKSSKKSFFGGLLEYNFSSKNQKPNFELEALKIQHFFNMDSNFLREKKKCHILSD
jgi:hypothetical protein